MHKLDKLQPTFPGGGNPSPFHYGCGIGQLLGRGLGRTDVRSHVPDIQKRKQIRPQQRTKPVAPDLTQQVTKEH